MKHINNDSQINVPLSASIDPCSGVMNAPQRVSPEQLPDPWLLDTEGLLLELARIRELALRIPPVRNDIIGPINSVIDGVNGTSNSGSDTASICTARVSERLHANTIKN